MPSPANKRQYLRSVLYDLFDALPWTVSRTATEPTTLPGSWLDLGIISESLDQDQSGDGPYFDAQWFLKVFVASSADTGNSGAVDAAIDAAVEEVDQVLMTWQGSTMFAGNGYNIIIESITRRAEIPTPIDKQAKGIVTLSGIIKFLQVS